MPLVLDTTGSMAGTKIGVSGVEQKLEEVHAKGWLGGADVLPIGGFYKARRSGEKHAWEAQTMHMLQSACDRASYDMMETTGIYQSTLGEKSNEKSGAAIEARQRQGDAVQSRFKGKISGDGHGKRNQGTR